MEAVQGIKPMMEELEGSDGVDALRYSLKHLCFNCEDIQWLTVDVCPGPIRSQ